MVPKDGPVSSEAQQRIIKIKSDMSAIHSVVFKPLNCLVPSPHLKNEDTGQAWGLITATPAFGKLRWEDYHSFEDSLG